MRFPGEAWTPALLAHGAAAACAGLLLFAVGQPFFTDDAWWHLALGRAIAEAGSWLREDPLLFGAAGPPSPAAWLFDRSLIAVHDAAGFAGLRALHVAWVAALLAGAWWLARRASASGLWASAATVALIVLSTYRFAQLRPHLATIGFTLLLYGLLIADGRSPSGRRIAASAALFALWANLHAAFPVGLVLLLAATAALAIAAASGRAASDLARARRLGLAWLAGAAATLCNPQGWGAYAAWFAAGGSTPSLERVIDEWGRTPLFSLPQPTLPPTPVAWLCVWGLLLGGIALAPRALADLRRPPAPLRLDPALVGWAAAAGGLLLAASRFLWLGFFPILLLARAAGPPRARATWALAAAPALLAGLFFYQGDWPLVTRALPRSVAQYAQPFAAHKYYPLPIWLARDAGLEGRLYCDYFQGGFAGYWLAPRVRTLVNGTLNVPAETLRDAAAMAARRGSREGESFEELLERHSLDLFLGIRPPETGNPHRPWASTTAHLEDTPGWIPVFRNLVSSLYLRDTPRNTDNLARVSAYYASQRVPFDPVRGFEAARVIREAPDWAEEQGLVPVGFARIEHAARTRKDATGGAARDRLAGLYAALGEYEPAIALDRARLAQRPRAQRSRRRLVWSLLRLGRSAEAEAALGDPASRGPDPLLRSIALAALEVGALEPGEARARVATLPVLHRSEMPWLLAGVRRPAPRAAAADDAAAH